MSTVSGLEQLTPAEFAKLRTFIYDRTGISLGDEKIALLSNRLRKRVRALDLPGFDDYYKLLAAGDDEEMSHFLSAVTTNETYFFRNEHLWNYVGGDLLTTVTREKQAKNERTLRFWSAASSTGAEAYTLAIVLKEKLTAFSQWDVRIVGSDISEKVLGIARAATYDAYAVNKLSPSRQRAYFRHDAAANTFELRDEVKRMVTFEFHNLRDVYTRMKFDVVFLRNVMMYFDLPMKRRVLKTVTDALQPGGHLIIGDVDPLRDGSGLRDDCDLEHIRPSVYRKPARRSASPLGTGLKGH